MKIFLENDDKETRVFLASIDSSDFGLWEIRTHITSHLPTTNYRHMHTLSFPD